ncbi:hypothetical protein CIK05_07545 [Bdellovibrio sp. qaytius]|nr:hypothetical protein CIK05_07545 [Bdellovibrio sp. qaytius]
MVRLLFIVLTLDLLTSSISYSAEDMDPAIKDVQELLRTQSKREEVIKNDSKAKQADDFALQAVGGNQTLKNDVYDVSADIMATVQKLSEGDPAKMNALLQKALQNPGEFLKSLPSDQQAKIRDIAAKTEAQKKSAPVAPKP